MGSWGLWNAGIAGFLGAAGVVLASVAAHRATDPSLATAAMFLIVHGTAVLALSALGGTAPATGFLVAGSLMLAGVALFSGDVTMRVLGGTRLFPMAAPTGGTLLIVAWLIAGASGILAALRAG